MKTNQLRLGNTVQVGKYIGNITAIYSNKIVVNSRIHSAGNVHKIPITKDILLKLGFEIADGKVAEYYHIGANKVTMDWLFDLCWIDGHEYPFYKNVGRQIKTVHQLQNLYFSLTGEELVLN